MKMARNAIKMKSLININNLVNLILNIYSFKISRKDGRKKKLNEEMTYINYLYNEINSIKLDIKQFEKTNIEPFIKSLDLIKKISIKYKCQVLRDLGKGEKPLYQ